MLYLSYNTLLSLWLFQQPLLHYLIQKPNRLLLANFLVWHLLSSPTDLTTLWVKLPLLETTLVVCIMTGPWLIHQPSPGIPQSSQGYQQHRMSKRNDLCLPPPSTLALPTSYHTQTGDKHKTCSTFCWVDLPQGCKLEIWGPIKACFVPCPWYHCLDSDISTPSSPQERASEPQKCIAHCWPLTPLPSGHPIHPLSDPGSTPEPETQSRKRGCWKNGSSIQARLCSSMYPSSQGTQCWGHKQELVSGELLRLYMFAPILFALHVAVSQ